MIANLRPLAEVDLPILITGGSGTGKTELAKQIHRLSPRKDAEILVRGCGTLPTSSFLAALFGHTATAYTGAGDGAEGVLRKCDGGTLVLDDIDALDTDQQVALLQFMDSGEFSKLGGATQTERANVRIIATTNRDLNKLVRERLFREDFLFRIGEFNIEVPNLSDRTAEIPSLVEEFAEEFWEEIGKGGARRPLAPPLLAYIQLQTWPGNLRELRAFVRQIYLFTAHDTTKAISLREAVTRLMHGPCRVPTFGRFGKEVRGHDSMIKRLLDVCEWNIKLTAELSGYSRTALYDIIERNNWRSTLEC